MLWCWQVPRTVCGDQLAHCAIKILVVEGPNLQRLAEGVQRIAGALAHVGVALRHEREQQREHLGPVQEGGKGGDTSSGNAVGVGPRTGESRRFFAPGDRPATLRRARASVGAPDLPFAHTPMPLCVPPCSTPQCLAEGTPPPCPGRRRRRRGPWRRRHAGRTAAAASRPVGAQGQGSGLKRVRSACYH